MVDGNTTSPSVNGDKTLSDSTSPSATSRDVYTIVIIIIYKLPLVV